jgi:hypothetical protein
MPTKKPQSDVSPEIVIKPLQLKGIKLRIIGTTPMIMNRMANKAMQELLVGGRKKTKADRVEMKHHPMNEYRNSVERMPGTRHLQDMPGTRHSQDTDGGPTLALKATAIKGAMCTAALETPGMTKTGAQRLLFMPAEYYPVWGTPRLRMDVVRSADINRTPDIRTRAEIEHWGTEIELQYIIPQLSMRSVVTLLCNAGLMVGVGDGRQEKGRLNRGLFRVLGEGEKDAEWDDLVAHHGRQAQVQALREPAYATEETAELMEFFFAEEERRAA